MDTGEYDLSLYLYSGGVCVCADGSYSWQALEIKAERVADSKLCVGFLGLRGAVPGTLRKDV